jgi:hypothetical protein
MCGRYTLTADLKKVADRFGAPMPEGASGKGESGERKGSEKDRNTTEILRQAQDDKPGN